MSTYDFAHAIPISGTPTGQLTLKTSNVKVTGMQKAIQNLTAVLLSTGGPVNTGVDFYAKLKRGYYRDKATMSADLAVQRATILALVNDPSRPANETITTLNVKEVVVSLDTSIIKFDVAFASGTSLPYELPVKL